MDQEADYESFEEETNLDDFSEGDITVAPPLRSLCKVPQRIPSAKQPFDFSDNDPRFLYSDLEHCGLRGCGW